MALLVASNLGYILLTFLPPIVWLLFYLREDEHPEPKRLITVTFIGGILIAVPAALVQYYGIQLTGYSIGQLTEMYPLYLFLFVALIEEYAKYFVVRHTVLARPEFDEPIDAMIYMMSAAMGFAAIENTLFTFPEFQGEFFHGLELLAGRFLGANLLHVLASGVLGFFIARGLLSSRRKIFTWIGILAATLLHTAFNYLIISKGALSEGLMYVIVLLLVIALIVFTEFERLKRKKVNLINTI